MKLMSSGVPWHGADRQILCSINYFDKGACCCVFVHIFYIQPRLRSGFLEKFIHFVHSTDISHEKKSQMADDGYKNGIELSLWSATAHPPPCPIYSHNQNHSIFRIWKRLMRCVLFYLILHYKGCVVKKRIENDRRLFFKLFEEE